MELDYLRLMKKIIIIIKQKLISIQGSYLKPGAHEPPKAAKERVTTVLSKYKLIT